MFKTIKYFPIVVLFGWQVGSLVFGLVNREIAGFWMAYFYSLTNFGIISAFCFFLLCMLGEKIAMLVEDWKQLKAWK